MLTKTLQTRIVHKHATEAEWNSSSLIPMKGELIIYDADSNHDSVRFKIGDGVHTVTELPFTTAAIENDIDTLNGELAEKLSISNLVTTITDDSTDSQYPTARAVAQFSVGRKGTGLRSEKFNNSNNVASGEDSHAEGCGTQATGNASHAEGDSTEARGDSSHAEGCSYGDTHVVASGKGAHAEGWGTTASDNAAHAEGIGTTASGAGSHAEGYGTVASGYYAHTEGYETQATNGNAHAEGYKTVASGARSHAEGNGAQATGTSSHAEGSSSIANGYASHAQGLATVAAGNHSHAEGESTVATSDHSHAQGRYNIVDNDKRYAHIVGNGSYNGGSPIRSNAHTIDWDGNAWFAGSIKVGGTGWDAENAICLDLATDEEIIELLIQEDMLPAIADMDDSILSDKDDNILSW